MANWKQFKGPGFTLQIFDNWMITASPQFQVVFIAPDTTDGLQANFAISIKRVNENVDVDSIATLALSSQEEKYPQYKKLDHHTSERNGIETAIHRYKWFHAKRKITIIQHQMYMIVSQLLYTLTASRVEDPSNANEIDEILTRMMDSFTVTEIQTHASNNIG